jgi:hypothetical protein
MLIFGLDLFFYKNHTSCLSLKNFSEISIEISVISRVAKKDLIPKFENKAPSIELHVNFGGTVCTTARMTWAFFPVFGSQHSEVQSGGCIRMSTQNCQ